VDHVGDDRFVIGLVTDQDCRWKDKRTLCDDRVKVVVPRCNYRSPFNRKVDQIGIDPSILAHLEGVNCIVAKPTEQCCAEQWHVLIEEDLHYAAIRRFDFLRKVSAA